MEATQEQNEQPLAATEAEATQQPTELTAKEMAKAEEENAARVAGIIRRQQEQLAVEAAEAARPTLIEVAAQGMDALHAAINAARDAPVPEYVPPPRTARQMTQLEAELAAGRRASERAKAQLAARPVPVKDVSEGFTTPVYRPDDMVPHPLGGMKPIQQ